MWGKIYTFLHGVILVHCPKLRYRPSGQPETQQMRMDRGQSQSVARSATHSLTRPLRVSLWTGALPLLSRGRRRMSVKLTPQGPTTHHLWKGRQKWTAFVDDNACDPQGTCMLFIEITGPQNSKPRLASQQEEVIRTKYGDKKAMAWEAEPDKGPIRKA